MKKLGEQIKELRIKKGITQEQLAISVGSTISSISNYERGKRNPPYPILYAIAEVLEIPAAELLSYTIAEENNGDNSIIENQTDKRPRRVKKLLAAFDKLSDAAQLEAIECVEKLGLIPMNQQTLPGVLQQYICNKCHLIYELAEDTGTPKPYGSEPISDNSDDMQDIRRITFYNGTKKNETLYWTFYCYDPEVIVDAETVKEIFTSVYANISFEPDNNLAFAFFDQDILDTFYSCYEDRQELPELDYEPSREGTPALFLLLDKETLQVKDVIDYDPNDY